MKHRTGQNRAGLDRARLQEYSRVFTPAAPIYIATGFCINLDSICTLYRMRKTYLLVLLGPRAIISTWYRWPPSLHARLRVHGFPVFFASDAAHTLCANQLVQRDTIPFAFPPHFLATAENDGCFIRPFTLGLARLTLRRQHLMLNC